MRLTTYTDYALRILIYLAAQSERQLASIKEIAETFDVSNHHISKIVFELGKLGLIETTRGRNGGICLAIDTAEINIGYVVRKTEETLNIVECFDDQTNTCKISCACRLKHILKDALDAYLQVLDSYTLADVMVNRQTLSSLINVAPTK
ncbi:Rrf2 family transcriptional regulator [Paenibacillus xerothermodurans]|uniref:HTH-type transcriptional regulator NsrR n=1 Tax=Paenibacillus xerothermodurans TaxID=1977292 RepID=A0A2W1N7R3_PAEXE|nr:Rrf2 family transcriptional regulator [Paenibacillus xerothermodurans]PZE19630.1 Rrf2 family transcriptional regulator [Paenibacillus xerothermodurans]